MWKVLFALIFIGSAHAQNFLEDVSKIQHTIAENEVDFYLKNPTQEGIPEIYLDALMPVEGFDPFSLCPVETDYYKPLDLKYRVILVSEEIPKDPLEQPKTTVVLEQLKFEEQPEGFAKTVDDFIKAQGSTPGKFSISETQSKGKQLITYSANGLSVNMDTNISATNSIGMDIKSENVVGASMSVDLVNRLGVTQEIAPGTQIRGTVESLKSTGTKSIDEIGNAGVEVDRVNAEIKLDSKIDDRVTTYTAVTFKDDNFTQEVKTHGGLNLTLPNHNNLIVLTGITSTKSPGLQTRSREYSVEFVTKRNFKWYGKIQNNDVQGRYYETGIKVDLDS